MILYKKLLLNTHRVHFRTGAERHTHVFEHVSGRVVRELAHQPAQRLDVLLADPLHQRLGHLDEVGPLPDQLRVRVVAIVLPGAVQTVSATRSNMLEGLYIHNVFFCSNTDY